MLYEVLKEKLDPRSGTVKEKAPNDQAYWQTALDIVWKGNIHFVVIESLFRRNYGHYYVMKDNQSISPTFAYTKIDDSLFRRLQSMIDDIESGKYANKRTLSEKIRLLAEQKNLMSCMNNTKWRELFSAIGEKVPDIELQYKLISEEHAPDDYWPYSGDEELRYTNPAEIEWLKIKHVMTDYTHIGRLVPPDIQIHDKQAEILQILKTYHIPHEYDEAEQVFVVYGYR